MRSSRIFIYTAIIFLIQTILFANFQVRAEILVISGEYIDSHPEDKKHLVSDRRIEEITADLRQKTGLQSIRFDPAGTLVYDELEKAGGGSAKLRRTIKGAIGDERNVFVIGDYSGRRDIHFAVTDEGTLEVRENVRYYRIKIDYRDFKNCRRFTPKEVLRAYTMAIILFHEIDHKTSYDPNDPIPAAGIRPDKSSGKVRGVIENTNAVRRELSLIERKADRHNGELYRGLVDFYRNTFQIRFVNLAGNRRHLRWKAESG